MLMPVLPHGAVWKVGTDMTFSEKLTRLRRQQGMSQEQLADRMDVTRQSVSKWESGAAMPELGKLTALSELFRVSLDY
jgi:transcriptional regulator with XRE-family HTH domain